MFEFDFLTSSSDPREHRESRQRDQRSIGLDDWNSPWKHNGDDPRALGVAGGAIVQAIGAASVRQVLPMQQG
jgi:hypothetical protein